MKFRLYGASDDLAEAAGDIEEEWGCWQSGSEMHHGTWRVLRGEEVVLLVHLHYNGVWSCSAAQAAEGVLIPDTWTIATKNEHAYATAMHIDTGDDVVTVDFAAANR